MKKGMSHLRKFELAKERINIGEYRWASGDSNRAMRSFLEGEALLKSALRMVEWDRGMIEPHLKAIEEKLAAIIRRNEVLSDE